MAKEPPGRKRASKVPFGDRDAYLESLDEPDMVAFVEDEHEAELARLDKMIEAHNAIRAEVSDEYASLAVDKDGRLVSLVIHDAAVLGLSYLQLERRINDMITAAVDAVRELHLEWRQADWD